VSRLQSLPFGEGLQFADRFDLNPAEGPISQFMEWNTQLP
jgi:hypothetical protein